MLLVLLLVSLPQLLLRKSLLLLPVTMLEHKQRVGNGHRTLAHRYGQRILPPVEVLVEGRIHDHLCGNPFLMLTLTLLLLLVAIFLIPLKKNLPGMMIELTMPL